MTTVPRAMDDLDRLAFRLVRTIRQHHPQLRYHGFTLTDLEERLLPYREARREMADGGADAWERTLLRLLTGERRYVEAPAELQHACEQALTAVSPALALVRTWSGSSLMLGEAAMAVGGERVSGAFEAARLVPEDVQQALTSMVRIVGTGAGTAPARTLAGSAGGKAKPRAEGCGCRYCGGKLPEGRRIVFCPHCGLDQTKRQCAACSTELDTTWRFCVTCGRSADLPEVPVLELDREKRAAS